MSIESLNSLVGLATLGMQIGAILLFGLYLLRTKLALSGLVRFFQHYGLLLAFLFTLASIVMSLVYSEYFGIVPCGLCWLQRVFLYPQAVLFAIALWKKETTVALYSIALSLLGAGVSLYQHYLQMGGASILPCPASGVSDCVKRFLFEFGYITFPLVAFSAFALLMVIMLFVRLEPRGNVVQ